MYSENQVVQSRNLVVLDPFLKNFFFISFINIQIIVADPAAQVEDYTPNEKQTAVLFSSPQIPP